MLRKLLVASSLLSCLCLSGCGVVLNRFNDGQVDTADKHPYTISKDTRDLFVEFVKNDDIASISELFCDATPVSPEEIDTLLNNIEGSIISIDNDGISGGLKESRDGVYTIYTYSAVCVAYTDIGREYTLSISGTAVWEGIPSRVGLDSIMVIDEKSKETYGVGLWKIG